MAEKRLQAAVDFLMSYGIAFLIIIIAIAVIYKISLFNTELIPTSCTPYPGFSCSQYSIATNGLMYITLAQATGSKLLLHGVACSSSANTINNNPAYGNIHVDGESAYYPSGFYSVGELSTGISMYSGSSSALEAYCYDGQGIASGPLGSGFLGYVWVNYTIPGYNSVITKAVALSMKYT